MTQRLRKKAIYGWKLVKPALNLDSVIPIRYTIKMDRLLFIIKNNWITLTLVILCAITFLSLWPLDKLPSAPGSDKIHHVIAYAFLMFPAALRKPKRWVLLGLLFIAYSGGIELLQPYVNRYGEWLDMAANITGIVLGAVIATVMTLKMPRTS